jgi:hypothetical protein
MGQTGYLVVTDAVSGTNVGYTINGWGKSAEVLVLTSGQ